MAVDTGVVPAPARESHATRWRGHGVGFMVKLALMALVNAMGLMVAFSAWRIEAWGIFTGSVVLLVVIDWIYFSRRMVPLKYLAPGVAFLLVFQIFTMAYTAYVAFTNYGAQHNVTKGQAIEVLLLQNERKVEGTALYPLTFVQRGDELGLAIVDQGGVRVGSAQAPLTDAPDAVVAGTTVTQLPGWDVIDTKRLYSDTDLANALQDLRVPVSEDPNDGSVRANNLSQAAVYRSVLVYDADTDTMVNVDTGVVYRATEEGFFRAEDGSRLGTGWRVYVGFDNFRRGFIDGDYVGPLLQITAWTFVFAVATVLSSFFLGLILALIFNDPRIKGRTIWRTLLILPYAFPAFLSALLWRGMFNARFGIINDWLGTISGWFGGGDVYIPWLQDPTLAKFVILWVNLWLSYPYWFLVCTGALQAVPAEMVEAARIDGATRFRLFRSVQLPLLLVSTAP